LNQNTEFLIQSYNFAGDLKFYMMKAFRSLMMLFVIRLRS